MRGPRWRGALASSAAGGGSPSSRRTFHSGRFIAETLDSVAALKDAARAPGDGRRLAGRHGRAAGRRATTRGWFGSPKPTAARPTPSTRASSARAATFFALAERRRRLQPGGSRSGCQASSRSSLTSTCSTAASSSPTRRGRVRRTYVPAEPSFEAILLPRRPQLRLRRSSSAARCSRDTKGSWTSAGSTPPTTTSTCAFMHRRRVHRFAEPLVPLRGPRRLQDRPATP